MHPILAEIRPGDVVFDVGANVGDKAGIFLSRGARVVCVEPQPKMVEQLYARYGNNADVVIVPKGVSERPGVQEMMICADAPKLSTFSEHWTKGRFADQKFDERATIEMTTLDWLIATNGRPRYCKIDVEGYELPAIGGLSQMVPYLSYEFTAEYLHHAMLVLEQMIKIGFREFNVGLGESDTFALDRWVPFYQLTQVLQVWAGQHDILWGDIYGRSPVA